MNTIAVSVVIATYNRHESLLKTLRALEKQTMSKKEFEVLVINDGSTDGTDFVLHRFGTQTLLNFTYLHQANKGPGAARNLGINKAKGAIIAFTDDDCLPAANWLEVIGKTFESRAIIGLQGRTTTDREKITPLTHQIDNTSGNKSVPTCNAAYDRHALVEIGGFDECFPYPHNEDADIAWRINHKGEIGFSSEMVVHHPPRVDAFSKVARRMKILESEFRLYYKDPEAYKLNRAASPWKNIYWEIGVKTQLYYLRSRLKYWKRPVLMLQGVALTLVWWGDLIRLLPRFIASSLRNRANFLTGHRLA